MHNFDLLSRRLGLWQQFQSLILKLPVNSDAITSALQELQSVDRFWAYPGHEVLKRMQACIVQSDFARLRRMVGVCVQELQLGSYRVQAHGNTQDLPQCLGNPSLPALVQPDHVSESPAKPYFEVLVVHPYPLQYEALYRDQLSQQVRTSDAFHYALVFVDSAQDALTALLANSDIQACVYLQHVVSASEASAKLFEDNSHALLNSVAPVQRADSVEVNLCTSARCLRPEIDHILISEQMDLQEETRSFDHILFHVDPFQSLHEVLLSGVHNRYATPFFDALTAYSRRPKAVFHALPVSQGGSINDSTWTSDMSKFYGASMLAAETSSTLGGLDSIQDPKGCILQAYNQAARTFGADHSFFVTNGTSTANKIVMQAYLRPGDIVLIAADCHKSVTHGAVQCGAYPVMLESYALPEYDLHGAVDLAQIKRALLDLQRRGLLDKVRQIVLTNSTFDGLVCNAEQYMMEVLAIKPDITFHWDEAWFAFGHFHPLYYSRTAMTAVAKLRKRLRDPGYLAFYAKWRQAFDADPDSGKWMQPMFPDPRHVQLRVCVTQSTHKTLSAFRQGSMIHVADEEFQYEEFMEAVRMHTTTSPNYQILASLDLARRQASLEGFRQVRRTLELALQLRHRIRHCPQLQPYIRVLEAADLIPFPLCEKHEGSPFSKDGATGTASELSTLVSQWGTSQLVLDPTRITLDIRSTGLNGQAFRTRLMDRYDVQVNKTTDATILLVVTIGTSQMVVDYLLGVLQDIVQGLASPAVTPAIAPLQVLAPAPRKFHPAFLPLDAASPWSYRAHCAVDVRTASFDGTVTSNIDHVPANESGLAILQSGRLLVSAALVTPYPPGYPLLVPGQLVTSEVFEQLLQQQGREIHGLHHTLGLRVFSQQYLRRASEGRTVRQAVESRVRLQRLASQHALEV